MYGGGKWTDTASERGRTAVNGVPNAEAGWGDCPGMYGGTCGLDVAWRRGCVVALAGAEGVFGCAHDVTRRNTGPLVGFPAAPALRAGPTVHVLRFRYFASRQFHICPVLAGVARVGPVNSVPRQTRSARTMQRLHAQIGRTAYTPRPLHLTMQIQISCTSIFAIGRLQCQ